MAIIVQALRKAGSKSDKIFKNVYKGEKGSPFQNVDDLGSPPYFRQKRIKPGTEVKKNKEIGKKIHEGFKKKDKEKKNKRFTNGWIKIFTRWWNFTTWIR